jgi:hypothetical protein
MVSSCKGCRSNKGRQYQDISLENTSVAENYKMHRQTQKTKDQQHDTHTK